MIPVDVGVLGVALLHSFIVLPNGDIQAICFIRGKPAAFRLVDINLVPDAAVVDRTVPPKDNPVAVDLSPKLNLPPGATFHMW